MCAHELFYSAVKWLLTILLGQLLPGTGLAQPYQSVNYRWEHGFTASAGYAIQQDKEGYIWIGTENGLMRFNGHDFKTYTTRDGLSDNEVVGMQGDSHGRLWLFPFTSAACFVYQGKIYNADNNAFLKSLRSGGWLNTVLEDRNGTLWFSDGGLSMRSLDTAGHSRYYVKKNYRDLIVPWLDAAGRVLWLSDIRTGTLLRYDDTGFVRMPWSSLHSLPPDWMVSYGDFLFDSKGGRFFYYELTDSGLVFTRTVKTRAFPGRVCVYRSGGDFFVLTDKGAYQVDIHTGVVLSHFLQGYKVGAACRTSDGAYWFGTIGQGIFRFARTPVRTLNTTTAHPFISCIKATDLGMCCVTDRSRLIVARPDGYGGVRWDRELYISDPATPYCPYSYVSPAGTNRWLTCGYGIKSIYTAGKPVVEQWSLKHTLKAVAEYDEDRLVVGTTAGVFFIDRHSRQILDSFMTGIRTSAVAIMDRTIYVGTLAGVYVRYPDRRCEPITAPWSKEAGRILALAPGKDNILWVAGSRELLGISGHRVVKRFVVGKDLLCNRISCMKVSGGLLWVGTDQGLFAINSTPPYKIERNITYATGLASSQVTCLDIHRGRVWVGTVRGINYFEETDLFRTSGKAVLIINNITNGSRRLKASNAPLLLENKPMTIEFDAIDFCGGARPVFEYRINEHGPWTKLEGNVIYFSTLPAGRFSVSIRAFAPNWSGSRLLRQEFYNPLPYYRTGWFTLSLGLLVPAAVCLLMWLVVKHIRNVYARKLAVQQNLLRLEQMALQGQMNPHFIFNCIAALRQYYNAGDRRQADNFVDAFSSLIRRTFEMGTETFVPLDKELEYLALYLKVEQTRFDGSFQYNIAQHTQLPAADIPVPAMLLQPFVENAIRHGIRHLPEQNGLIHVLVRQEDGIVHIEITDNGIGIRKSMEMKKQLAAGHLSSSIVNNKRIAILNRLLDGKVELKTGDALSGGTIVTLRYPININQLIIL